MVRENVLNEFVNGNVGSLNVLMKIVVFVIEKIVGGWGGVSLSCVRRRWG